MTVMPALTPCPMTRRATSARPTTARCRAVPTPAGPPSALRGTDPSTAALLDALATSHDPGQRARARAELIERQLPFARFLARRFRNRGESLDDLHQVAALGLIKAIDGFDIQRGDSFSSYAIPTILGELRRHFRDKGWAVRPPRRLQELRADVAVATERLTHDLGRSPTQGDLSDALGVAPADVRNALAAGRAYSADSVDAACEGGPDGPALVDVLPDAEPGYDLVETRACLRGALDSLSERERRILGLRYYAQLTQSEIAAELGISQMHVSRLLRRSLDSLRERLSPTG